MAATLAIIVALITFQGAPSIQAAVTTLISNTGQTTHPTNVVTLGTGASDDSRAAQSFIPGTDADVSSIGIKLATVSDLTNAGTDLKLEIYSDASSEPDSAICTLSDPATFTADAVNEFTAPTGPGACPRLLTGTVYHAVLERVATTTASSTVTVSTTSNNTEDTSGATGWSIGNTARKYDSSWSVISTYSLQVQIKGDSIPANQSATGLPVVYPSSEGAGILLADLSGVNDANGLTYNDNTQYNFSYQWIRVDGNTASETNVGADSTWYQSVDADIGNLIKVEVSFTDGDAYTETVTSLTFGPLRQPAGPPAPASETTTTLVSNTGQSPSTTSTITQQYAMGFRLGKHGQGYEISSVSIDLAAAPSTLTVSLWTGAPPDYVYSGAAAYKLFDFENPDSFAVGLNKFTAPTGAFAYQNVEHFIVLSGFGSSLQIKQTSSDAEDAGGETGAILFNTASVRGLNATGRWPDTPSTRNNVLQVAVEGSKRTSGILASNYAQTQDQQEIISIGDEGGMPITLGPADRYLIRGFSWLSDDSTTANGGITNPFDLRSGWSIQSGGPEDGNITDPGTKWFSLINTREAAGITAWSAPQGATVTGSDSYLVYEKYDARPDGVSLSRFGGTSSDDDDAPTAMGVTLSDTVGSLAGRPVMAILGEPLYTMVQNLDQTGNNFIATGGTNTVLSQGFTTGSQAAGYGLLGIGVNIEGSDDSNGVPQLPKDATSVAVAVHADSSGRPGAKLFDLVSPAEYTAGHSFFEAPPGASLNPNTAYVMVWTHLGGTEHRLQRTSSNNEDEGADAGASIADRLYEGPELASLTQHLFTSALEIAVYTDTPPKNATGQPVIRASAEGAPYLFAETSEIRDANGLPFKRASDPDANIGDGAGGPIEFVYSYRWIRVDGGTETNIGTDSPRYNLVDADYGKNIKVEVSFTDQDSFPETVTSDPVPAVRRAADSLLTSGVLVGNTGQTSTADATITKQYAMGFTLGDHGQGYELSTVSIELAAVPADLTVSLWIADHADKSGTLESKIYDLENPGTFAVGANEFTAPPGALLYPNIQYAVVLSGYTTLSIKETTSDGEDSGGETGAVLKDKARIRDLDESGRWGMTQERSSSAADRQTGTDPNIETPVLRLAISGYKRQSGILASTYGQSASGDQEIISLGDQCCVRVDLGAADRYLIRGFSWNADDSTDLGAGITNPFELRDGSTSGDHLYRLFITRNIAGVPEWSAPRGATVAGGTDNAYFLSTDWGAYDHIHDGTRTGHTLTRAFGTQSKTYDTPLALDVSFSEAGDVSIPQLLAAILGEPLYAMVQNLGQTDNSYHFVGGFVPTQCRRASRPGRKRAATGCRASASTSKAPYSNLSGKAQLPDDATSVSVSLYTADADGKPDTKLFDLLSPDQYAPGHSFFEAPAGKTLAASTTYVMVWTRNTGTAHRLQITASNGEDAGAFGGATITDAFYRGSDLANLTVDSGGNSLEIAVYTDTVSGTEVYTDISSGGNATGQPVIRASAEGAPYLFADTSGLRDEDGLPFTNAIGVEGNIGDGANGAIKFFYTYQWIRVDGMTETNIGTDSAVYHLVDADYGKLVKVKVSFTDQDSFPEIVTSDPFRPVRNVADTSLTSATLVSNTGQTNMADAAITKQYAMGFTLGGHGQGYELSTVSIELAAVPAALTVSLWIADHADKSGTLESKIYDLENPAAFAVGANTFKAPPGVLLHQNIQYGIVLSGYTSLSIKETTSDAEDTGGETGAELTNTARERNLGSTGRWASSTSRSSVLRLAISGSKRQNGILASTYGQTASDDQEIISLDDRCCFEVNVGAADRYLIRGFSWNADDTTVKGGGITNPFHLRDGSITGNALFDLYMTRNIAGAPEWSAPQGATVAGGSDNSYFFSQDWAAFDHIGDGARTGHAVSRIHATKSKSYDTPLALGMTFSDTGDVIVPQMLAAILGEPLHAMVQNLGQTNSGHASVGGTNKLRSQAFTTGSETGGYRLQGIGVNIEGATVNGVAQVPDDATSVTVSLYTADANGLPDTKLFDFVSPDEYAPGHSFFEAPAGTTLAASTSYVMVWRNNSGTPHRLQRTTSNSEDSGAFGGATIADAYYFGSQLAALTVDTSGTSLEIAVYTDTAPGAVVYTDISPGNVTGLPVVLASAEGGGAILAADTSRLADEDGLPYTGSPSAGIDGYVFSYQWFRVDGETETEVGTDSQQYQLVDADYGKLIKVRVSFVDRGGNREVLDSLPFGLIVKPPPSAAPRTLVGNTGQTPSAAANISGNYAMGFKLGSHGQGYEISSVSIDLAAVPSTVSVSLWNGGPRGSSSHGSRTAKLFDFENPSSLQVGLNKFRAPAGAFAYQNLNYWIVLSDFGDSLSIKETTSDAEDAGGETGAILFDEAGGDSGVLRLAVEGSKRDSGILASNYAQPSKADTPHPETGDPQTGDQEITSVGDKLAWGIVVGAADRYLVRGVSFAMDDTTTRSAGFINPFALRSDSLTGDRHFDLANTRDANGTPVWTAPQGATVAGGCTTAIVMMVEEVTCKTYIFDWADLNVKKQNDVDRIGAVLTRMFAVTTDADGQSDDPTAPGVSLTVGRIDGSDYAAPTPLMAVHGEALIAMVKNFGETDNTYFTVGASYKVVSQSFTTGSDILYRLQGIGFDIEGSVDTNMVPQIPDDASSVAVAVHADLNGKPGEKLFDLLSPTDYAAGHSFFEAPPGAFLTPDTPYQVVWTHLEGTEHRLRRTAGDDEDSGARTGASIADGLHRGTDITSLGSGTNSLELAVYTEIVTKVPFVEGGIDVPLGWLHIPDGAEVGYQFRTLFVTHRGTLPTSAEIEHYNDFVQWEAGQAYNDSVVRNNAPEFKAVACTAALDARTNTGMNDFIGVPVHWLDGGWEHRPTLVANSNVEFYSAKWVNAAYGAYVTGNTAYFHPSAKVWTGCDASGAPHPMLPMGTTGMDHMVAVGTPNDPNVNNGPLGAVDVADGYPYHRYRVVIDGEELERLLPLYAISPIFTVVDDGSERTIWSSSITVETAIQVQGATRVDRAGFAESHGIRLGSLQFTYEGTSYSLTQLRTAKTTTSGSVLSDIFELQLSSLFPIAADSKLALELDDGNTRRRFLLSEADRQPTFYRWDDHGLTWTDGNFVEIKLIELREGVESDSPPVVKISSDLPPVVKISADSPLVPDGPALQGPVPADLPIQHSAQCRVHRYRGLQHVRAGPGCRRARGHPGPQRRVPGGGLHRGRGRAGQHRHQRHRSRDLVAGGRQGGRQLRGLLRRLLGRGGHREGRVGRGRHHSL